MFDLFFSFGLEDYLSVLGLDGPILAQELPRGFCEVVISPGGIREALNKFKRFQFTYSVVALEFFSQCFHQDQLPGILVR